MKAIKKTLNFFIIKSVIRSEENPLVNEALQDVIVDRKPKSDKSAKKIVIETLGIEPDFEGGIMIIDIQPTKKTYEMDFNTFIENANKVEPENRRIIKER